MKIFPIIKKVLQAAGATFTAPEAHGHADDFIVQAQLPEAHGHADDFSLQPVLPEAHGQADAIGSITATLTASEGHGHADVATFTVGPQKAVIRSGAPDADDWGDGWTDNSTGQTGTNHGNVSPLAMAVGVAGAGINLAWVEINFGRFTGLTAVGGVHTITGVFSNGSAIVASTITLKAAGQASRPFTESTLKQNNQPATPAGFALTQNLAAGAANVTLTFTLTDAQMNQLLGQWAVLQFSSSGGTTALPDTLVSREGATANLMTYTFTAQR